MKLRKVHIQTYRSIIDSGIVDIEDGVTVVIGKNEQGKSNFLRAIAAFNPDREYSPGDLPNHLRPSLEEKNPGEIPVTTLWFSIEPEDQERLSKVLVTGNKFTELKCIRYYDNTYGYWGIRGDGQDEKLEFSPPEIAGHVEQIKQAAEDLKAKLEAHTQRLAAFAPNKEKIVQITAGLIDADFGEAAQVDNLIETHTTALKGLTAQDQAIQEDIANATKKLDILRDSVKTALQVEPVQVLKQTLPFFVLHRTKADQIPNEVKIADFVKDPDGTSKGMSNLCRAAGLSTQKILELANTGDTSQREAYEDHYKAWISGGLNEFWTQEQYDVHFRIEKEKLSVSISDGTYSPRIAPSDRSEGFQWYLSFYATLLNDVGVSKQTILLLDNPGLELHVDGQRDIKRFLEERVTLNSQVIYVTHSPAMIDSFNLRQLRTVVLRGNQGGTKVGNLVVKEGFHVDLLEPVRSAIGMSLIASLIFDEWNVLVEGAADKPVLEGALALHKNQEKFERRVLVNGSLAESKDLFLAHLYQRTGLPFVVVLDADDGGRELARELQKRGINGAKVIKLDLVFEMKGRDFALEDILSADFYHRAAKEAYPSQSVDMPEPSAKKRATAYEEAFRSAHQIGFNKRRVAETVKKLLEQGEGDKETNDNLAKLTSEIIKRLREQSSEGVAPKPAQVVSSEG